ncbi:DUF2505 family protein [bacterium SPL81]|nr:DUF2505 family protein [Acinetobacter baumannii]
MTHTFDIESRIQGIPLELALVQLRNPEFHELICRSLPASNINILESKMNQSHYSLKRQQNMDVDIPKIAQKFLKDAFRLYREDHWDINNLTFTSYFKPNMPGEFKSKTTILVQGEILCIHQKWEVVVNVPLIHGILAKHAESEIRKFQQIEIDVIQKELMKHST